MKRSKTIAVAGASLLVLGLAACSSSAPAADGSAEANGNKNIVFVPGVTGDVFYTTMQCGIESEAKAKGVTVTMQGPAKFDASLQKPVLDSVVSSRPGAIVIAPTDAEAMRLPIEQAMSKGIKVVLADTTLANTAGTVGQISSNNTEGGAKGFEALQQLAPEGGPVLMIGNAPGITTTDERLKGFSDAAKADAKFEVLEAQYNQNDPAKTAQIVTATLQAHPDLVGVFAATQPAATGAATGIQQAGKRGQVKLIAFDASPDLVEAVTSDAIQALIAQQPGDMGKQAVDAAVSAMDGGTDIGAKTTGFTIITKDNVGSAEGKAATYTTSCG